VSAGLPHRAGPGRFDQLSDPGVWATLLVASTRLPRALAILQFVPCPRCGDELVEVMGAAPDDQVDAQTDPVPPIGLVASASSSRRIGRCAVARHAR
jgi:hypothetical protein